MKLSRKEREWRLIQRLTRRAEKGLKVPDGFFEFAAGLGLFIVELDKAHKEAVAITTIRLSEEHGLSYVQAYLDSHRPNALTHIMMRYEEHKQQQQDRAKRPRTRKTPTIKSLTIAKMHKWRLDGHTLEEFIVSAKNKGIYKLSMEEFEEDNQRKFNLIWDGIEKDETKVFRTLENWWTQAQKRPI